eukprot:GHUV01027117.1.p1 GENE.GHUV01027117.1~~GHUV01027117.1.p1  ORF type:complete len:144 (-),score=25.88 GHUV01027117.1:558-989(-)
MINQSATLGFNCFSEPRLVSDNWAAMHPTGPCIDACQAAVAATAAAVVASGIAELVAQPAQQTVGGELIVACCQTPHINHAGRQPSAAGMQICSTERRATAPRSSRVSLGAIQHEHAPKQPRSVPEPHACAHYAVYPFVQLTN